MSRYVRKVKGGLHKDEHRIVMEEFLGRPLEGYELVHHINNDPKDNRIENLELTTRSDHARCHLMDSPCYGKGSQNHQSKLHEGDIPWIRLWLKQGYDIYQVAKIFGVHRRTIRDIELGNTWVEC